MGPERGFGPFGGPGGYGSGGDSAVAILSTVLRFVVWVLVILAIVWIVREVLRHTGRPGARRQQSPPSSPALAELELRYARGEVTREDYLTRRADLGGAVAAPPPPSF